MTTLNKSKTSATLIQMLLVFFVIIVLVFLQFSLLQKIYSGGQLSSLGLILNGIIAVLFLSGMLNIILGLLHYGREQKSLRYLVRNVQKKHTNPMDGVASYSAISQRCITIDKIHRQNSPVDHAALASILLSIESARFTFVRFVQNMLILFGVFGTIISLSVALLGASDLLQSPENMHNMALVVDGMSTALSTTMTAIVCYIIYGYFYLRLRNVQTLFLSGLEEVTTLYLLPKTRHDSKTVIHEISNLITQLHKVTQGMQKAQALHNQSAQELNNNVQTINESLQGLGDNLQDIKDVLREGFRLPPDSRRLAKKPHDYDIETEV